MFLTKYHHLGVAVRDMQKAIAVHADIFGSQVVSGPFDDPIQCVSVCFLQAEGSSGTMLELVAPLDDTSPVARYLKKGIGAYHMCYEVEDMEKTLEFLYVKGCQLLSGPVPAVAFSGRRIAWVYTPSRELIEILEE
jgi:methylmalonyl-CoA/ethylmalonyl-CoA epimerase